MKENMRKLFYTLVIVATLDFCANAQVRVGVFGGYTTANDKSEFETQDGGDFFPGFTASARFREGKRFSFGVRGDVARTAQIPTLFTTDEGKGRPDWEIRVNPEARFNFGKAFVGVGFDAFYQGGLYVHPGTAYSRSYGINPAASAGFNFTRNHEASYTYLLRDKGTDLYGHRVNYFYTLPKGFRVGFEANQLTFKERDRKGYIDSYYEVDNAFKVSFEVPLSGRK